jgi:hypothetical protein
MLSVCDHSTANASIHSPCDSMLEHMVHFFNSHVNPVFRYFVSSLVIVILLWNLGLILALFDRR